MSDENTNQIRQNMTEKLGWAERTFRKMKGAKPVELQDDLWTFLHAAQLVWFYFGRWVRAVGGSKGEAKRRVQCWQAKLTPDEQATWIALNKLRDYDVHIEPVNVDLSRGRGVLVREAKIIVHNRAVTTVEVLRYLVHHNGRPFEVFSLCEQGLDLLRRFIADFDSIHGRTQSSLAREQE